LQRQIPARGEGTSREKASGLVEILLGSLRTAATVAASGPRPARWPSIERCGPSGERNLRRPARTGRSR
jgi:hypothetical protein